MANRDLLLKSPKQSGVVLITSLIFLVILTLIVLAVLRSGTLEERMAANARNRELALQAAEAVLRDAEVLFTAPAAPIDPFNPAGFTGTCTNGFCSRPATGDTPKWKTITWSDPSVTRSFAPGANPMSISTDLVASPPRYIVEVMSSPIISPSAGGGICPAVLYRLTGRGVGQDSSEVYVQTMYRSLPAHC